jgi:hypothetical protein
VFACFLAFCLGRFADQAFIIKKTTQEKERGILCAAEKNDGTLG